MTWSTDFAKEFKNRNNESKIGAVIGTVLDRNNLKIGILNNQVLLDLNNCTLTKNFKTLLDTTYNNNGSITHEVNNGDLVLVIASDNNKNFYIIDKLI